MCARPQLPTLFQQSTLACLPSRNFSQLVPLWVGFFHCYRAMALSCLSFYLSDLKYFQIKYDLMSVISFPLTGIDIFYSKLKLEKKKKPVGFYILPTLNNLLVAPDMWRFLMEEESISSLVDNTWVAYNLFQFWHHLWVRIRIPGWELISTKLLPFWCCSGLHVCVLSWYFWTLHLPALLWIQDPKPRSSPKLVVWISLYSHDWPLIIISTLSLVPS